MGCKEEIALVIRADAMRFNRNIMGCKVESRKIFG